ncbi:DUF5990 family protein [Streptomyces salyersiae]|uniref:DUF5990 family protein n=1 Tax=Streptomyces salyersiae TaxID=3075530 RepID=A0ABU2RCF6_9ACTN|nr:DUF5990 family protein [Streptomyces sp. DSM 41770]MDT0426550.1 DUF5990 family protein [Streptomyces sp. DSM 41770]
MTVPDDRPLRIRIEATDLPGLTWPPGPDSPGRENVHVGVQRKDSPGELTGLHPADAASVSWTLDCTAVSTPEGVEVSGPYVQHRMGGRFVYLSWGTVDGTGLFSMFRRAKLMMADVGPDVLGAAMRSGRLTARLRLSDGAGRPRCARVRPPDVVWSAGQGT